MSQTLEVQTIEARVINAHEDLGHCRVSIEGDTITAVEPITSTVGADGTSGVEQLPIMVPGFIDLHNHGGNKGAFPTGSEEDCRRAALFHRTHGSTTLYASTVSGNAEELTRQARILAPLVDEGLIAGIHLEGPFVNPCKCGAQNPDRITPGDPQLFREIIKASGNTVRSMTFAPETAHVQEIIDICAEENVLVSLGHTDGDYETTLAAIEYAAKAGATVTATHLFNAMPPIHHRAPGAAGALIAQAAEGNCYLELIGDNVHLHPGTVDMVARALPDAVFAVTDAMEAAGIEDGKYILGALDVVVKDGVARLATTDGSEGALAGGTSTLADQFRIYAQRHPEDLPAAVRFTSTNAARVIQKSDTLGDIAPGYRADLVLMDQDLNPSRIFVAGQEQPR